MHEVNVANLKAIAASGSLTATTNALLNAAKEIARLRGYSVSRATQEKRDALALVASMQSVRDRLMPVLSEQYGDAFDGDFDVLLDATNFLKRRATALSTLARASR